MKLRRLIGRSVKSMIRSYGYDIVRHKPLSELLDLHNVDVVFDIGANDGGYASELRSSGWNGRVVSFEPQPLAYARLSKRFSHDHMWSGHQLGLGSEDATMAMNIHEMDVLSSFLSKIEDSGSVTTVDVKVKRMDAIIDDILGDYARPFVKIDTQGFEMEILKGFGSRTSEVVGWQLEMSIEPLYENQPKMDNIVAYMRELGFSLWRILPGLRDPGTLRAYELDGIFFRSP